MADEEQPKVDQLKADKAKEVRAARLKEAQDRIENEEISDVGLDRRKEHEQEMAGRQAQEQIDAEVARAEEMMAKKK